jgi:hypothetical protein
MANKRNIKQGGGADVRSSIYSEMGALRTKPTGLARHKPIRGEKQRSKGRSSSR